MDHVDGIEAISKQWDNLLRKANCLKPYLSPTWCKKACEIFDEKPKIFCGYKDQELVALLPLTSAPDIEYSPHLSFPRVLLGDSGDIVVDPRYPQAGEEVLRVCVELLGDQKVFFRDIRKDSILLQSFAKLLEDEELEFSYNLEIRMIAPLVDLSQGWNEYLASKSANFRSFFGRIGRKLEAAHFSFRNLEPGDERMNEALEVFMSGSSRRIGEKALYAGERVRSFVMKTFPLLAQQGFLNFYVLEQDREKRIRGTYIEAQSFPFHDFWYMHGYDEEIEPLRPGNYMLFKAIENAAKRGCEEYDLNRTTNNLKERIKTGQRSVYLLTVEKE